MAKVFEIDNFLKGYDDSINEEMSPPESTQNCLNTDYTSEPGAVSKDVGERWIGGDSVVYPLTGATQAIYEGSIYGDSNESFDKRLLINDGIFYMYCDGGMFIPLASGTTLLPTTGLIDVTHYYKQFLIAGGSSKPVYTWDGFTNTVTSLTMSMSIGGSTSVANDFRANCVEPFRNRIFLGNVWEYDGADWNINENTVRWSNLGLPGTLESDSYVDIIDKEGDEIVRLKAYADKLLIFKKYSLHKLTYVGGEDFPFEASAIDYRTINNAPYSIAETPLGLVFLNEEGLQITDGEVVKTLPADKAVTALLRRLYAGSMHLAYAISSDTTQEYILTVPLDGSTTNNHIISWNWKYNTWRVSDKTADVLGLYTNNLGGTWNSIKAYYGVELAHLSWNSSKLYPDSRDVILGKSDGYVTNRSISYNIGSSTPATYGTATYGTSMYGGISGFDGYICFHETPWLDLKNPGVYKEVVRLQPMWKGSKDASVTVKYKADDDVGWSTASSDVFNATNVIEQPILVLRSHGRKFKFRFENSNANETFTIYRFKIFYEERNIR
jgi:hypothetical protein